jgi:IS30 family transposase
LLLKAKKKPKSAPITRVNKINKNNRSIELRPKFIDERKEFGHWEMDTVFVKRNGKHSCLLVLTERMTRYEIIKKINGKTQFDVLCALNDMERKYQNFNDVFKTITIDNGTEFSCQSLLERSCINPDMNRFVAYFCHPYSSFERGSNENQNRIIRRFIPKGSDIDKYSDKDIKHIENWVNTYPRRILNFASPAELFNKYVNC